MPMDAYREDGTFVVHLDLPGVSADSIDLTVEQNVLTVHAERQPPVGDGAERVVDSLYLIHASSSPIRQGW